MLNSAHRSWGIGVKEFWNDGRVEDWSSGVLE